MPVILNIRNERGEFEAGERWERCLTAVDVAHILICGLYMMFALTCFVIAIQNYFAPTQGWFHPTQWMALDSVFMTIACCIAITISLVRYYRVKFVALVVELAVYASSCALGSVALWANNSDWQQPALYTLVEAYIIIKWIKILAIIIVMFVWPGIIERLIVFFSKFEIEKG